MSLNIEIELDEFDDEDIRKYASEQLGMGEYDVETVEDCVLLGEVENRGYTVVPNTYYPNNDIISQDLISRFTKGFGKIDKNELEQFLTKFGV